MKLRLIVNADDYGRTPSVSRGILDAHLNGIVTTTTVMINLPGALEDVRRGIENAPTLAFGVHLNLTCGKPLTPPDRVPTLIGANGWFHGKDHIFNNPEMLELLATTANKLVTGEIDQIDRARSNTMTEAAYYEMIEDKTASLVATGCKLGAMTTSDDPEVWNALFEYGRNFGIAFQIKDDSFSVDRQSANSC